MKTTNPLDTYTLGPDELDPPELLHLTCKRFVFSPALNDLREPTLGDYIRAANRHTLECENDR